MRTMGGTTTEGIEGGMCRICPITLLFDKKLGMLTLSMKDPELHAAHHIS